MELHNLIKSSNIIDIEKYLIKNPEVINKVYTDTPNYYTNQTLLLYAIEFSDIKTIKLLLDYGANINMYVNDRYSALVRSMNNKRVGLGVIKLLLDYGANPNLEDYFSMKGLSHAIHFNLRDAVLILLKYDAHYDGKDIETTTLVGKIKLLNIKNWLYLSKVVTKLYYSNRNMELHNLIKSSNIVEIEKYLIKNPETINKTYPDAPNYYKYQTPLLCAVEFSNIETVKLLLDYGANTNMSVHKRCFPLYKCKNSGKLKLLLDYGANPNLEDDYNKDDYNKIAIFHTMFYGAIPILLEYDSHCNGGSTKTAILAEKIRLLNTKNWLYL